MSQFLKENRRGAKGDPIGTDSDVTTTCRWGKKKLKEIW
jgi:hypothetical protein